MKKVILIVIGFVQIALGCSCSLPTVEESAKWADAVFSGKVQKTEPHPRDKDVVWLYVMPEKQWKGKTLPTGQVKIWYHRTCGMRAPTAGSRVLLYVQAVLDYHHTGSCARTGYTEQDDRLLDRLFKKPLD